MFMGFPYAPGRSTLVLPNRNTMESPITFFLRSASRFLSGATLCAFVLFAPSCEIDPQIDPGFSGPYVTGNTNNGPVTFEYGTLSSDSVISFAKGDSLYGHFTPTVVNEKYRVKDFGFYVYINNSASQIFSFGQDMDWHFSKFDTVVSCRALIPQITTNVQAKFNVFLTWKDARGNEYTFQSDPIVIREFEPAFKAVQDSVTYPESGKAILWGHLETTIDCDILDVQIASRWNAGYSPTTTVTPITLPQHLKAKAIQIRDTIDVLPNWQYLWAIVAKGKFANESLATTPRVQQTFITPE
jgi:hypothetical protein